VFVNVSLLPETVFLVSEVFAQVTCLVVCVDIVSSDILSSNEKSATMQDQSQGRTRREHGEFLGWFGPSGE
jgi:hypothetical protein